MPDGSGPRPYEGWAVVEVMGHRRLGGYVRPAEQYGVTMLRVDVPAAGGLAAVTQFYGGGSIFCLTPCDEETAARVAAADRSAPVGLLSLPVPRGPGRRDMDDDMEDIDDRDDDRDDIEWESRSRDC